MEYSSSDIDQSLKTISGAQILLIEDNEINQEIATELLTQYDFNVSVADDGESGLAMLRESVFDLVLMDIQMPGIDGYETTKIIRQDVKYRNLPIIAMTAYVTAYDRNHCLEVGMNAHISKPVIPLELYKQLLMWIPAKHQVEPIVIENPAKALNGVTTMPDLAGIAVSSGLQRVGGNKECYCKLLYKFLANNKETMQIIRAAYTTKNLQVLQNLSHSVNGVAGNLGATSLARAAQELEKSANSEAWARLSELIDVFEISLNEVLLAIADIRPDDETQAIEVPLQTAIDTAAVAPLLEHMMVLLNQDLGAAFDLLEKLRPYFINTVAQQQFHDFEVHLDNMDIDQALTGIKGIAQYL